MKMLTIRNANTDDAEIGHVITSIRGSIILERTRIQHQQKHNARLIVVQQPETAAIAAARALAAYRARAAVAARTLDVEEPQVLLHVADDPDGFPWHHRLLVLHIEGGQWVSLDLSLHLPVLDFGLADYILLDRNAFFPRTFIRTPFTSNR